ncbi:hypothetical protein OsJ_01147 [Oryza sativa Japonica Group]|uniref:Uncharacterized protein n=1 Tax=Oryza sativa subsp. japonica TaxID=39947 RepID=B9EV08_ORYSJ|nr:hypothetical protein OsJ_01147 [Oryza sativa Japonica Group]
MGMPVLGHPRAARAAGDGGSRGDASFPQGGARGSGQRELKTWVSDRLAVQLVGGDEEGAGVAAGAGAAVAVRGGGGRDGGGVRRGLLLLPLRRR